MTGVVKRSALYFMTPVVGAGIALSVLPLATRVLGPAEYGALAIALALASLCLAAGSAALGYVLPEHLLETTGPERRALLGSAVIGALGAALAAGLLIIVGVLTLPTASAIGSELQRGITICVVGAVLGVPWQVCSEMLMLEGRAGPYTLGNVSQGMTNALTILGFLYIVPLPAYALYLGNFAGQCLLLVLAIWFLSGRIEVPRTAKWFQAIRKNAVACGAAAAAENGRTLFERTYLGAWATVSEVGLLVHAQLYRNWAMLALNAVSKAIWPTSLREAKAANPNFAFTNASWALVQAGLSLTCAGFALFGNEFIALLTNNKFPGAGAYALILLTSLLVQSAGKPQMTLLIAHGFGGRYARIVTTSTIAGVAASALLVPYCGALGVAWATFFQYGLMRVLIVRASASLAVLPFRDGWVLIGLAGAGVTKLWVEYQGPSAGIRLLAWAGFAAAAAALTYPQWRIFLDSDCSKTLATDVHT